MTAKRRCKFCKEYGYDHIKILAGSFCNYDHATKWGLEQSSKKKEKASKKAFAEKKRKFYENDRPLRMREAQKAFNAFIRERDKGCSCISCGRLTGCKMNAGHFKSVGAHPELRFEELNCHLQCEHCNSFKSGNISQYIPNLIKKIGRDKFNYIEEPHKAKKYSCKDLKEIELYYKQKLKELGE